MTNCINCGAVLHSTKCEYCGTEYKSVLQTGDGFSVEFDENKYNGVIRLNGMEYEVYLGDMVIHSVFCDSGRNYEGKLYRDYVIPEFRLIGTGKVRKIGETE